MALFGAKGTLTHLVITVVLGAAGYFVAHEWLNYELSLGGSVALELVIFLVIFTTPRLLASAVLRRDLSRVFQIVEKTPVKGLPVVLRLMGEELEELDSRLARLRNLGQGIPNREVSHWVKRRCFEVTRGQYIAADSNPPSRFLHLYREYLEAHEDFLNRTGANSRRILLVGPRTLSRDRLQHPHLFNEFVRWHADHNVELGCVPIARAREFRARFKLPTTDVAYWEEEFALLWVTRARVAQVQLVIAGEQLYTSCRRYLGALLEASQPFPA